MNGKEFFGASRVAIAAGKSFLVEVTPAVLELGQEGILDPGMRGYVTAVVERPEFDDEVLYEVFVDVTFFMDFNEPFEQTNWYGHDGTLVKARGTNNWPENNLDSLWFGPKDDVTKYLKVVKGGAVLFKEFIGDPYAVEHEETYIQWLERELELERAKFAAVEKMVGGMNQRVENLEKQQ